MQINKITTIIKHAGCFPRILKFSGERLITKINLLRFSMSLILVTGGAGFIGSHVVERLLEKHEVICLDNFDPYYDPQIKRENIAAYMERENFRLVEGDIRDEELLRSLLREGVEYVIHEAAQAGVRASLRDPKKVHEVNTVGTLKLLHASVDSDVKKIVNASSSSVYGKVEYLPFDEMHPTSPVSPYGVSKLAAEYYCRVFEELYGIRTVSLRYFTVYGPRMRPDLAISIFTRRALKNEPIEIFGDGTKTRDFTYITDAVDATLISLEKGRGAYNIGGGSRISIRELAEKIIEITGSKSRIIYSPDIKGDAVHTWANVERARKELGWSPKIKIDEGLQKYLSWLKPNS
jgi:UDP-glucose 4-epimerase